MPTGSFGNGLGIIRHISFYNKDFMDSHPNIIVEKKSDSPDEDKYVHDSRLLIPTLKDFFKKHPFIKQKVFLGDAAFDTLPIYRDLLTGDTFGVDKHFLCVYIPLNKRFSLADTDSFINENGISRQKFIRPMTTWDKCDKRISALQIKYSTTNTFAV